jgi:hypothetical protein
MEAPPLERKLVAILAADVEGYSRLMGIDEEGTLRTLSESRGTAGGSAGRPVTVSSRPSLAPCLPSTAPSTSRRTSPN